MTDPWGASAQRPLKNRKQPVYDSVPKKATIFPYFSVSGVEDAVVLEVGGRAAEDLVLGGVLVLEVADQMTLLALEE